MKFADVIVLDGKSGEAKWRDLLFLPLDAFPWSSFATGVDHPGRQPWQAVDVLNFKDLSNCDLRL